jgi:hypothetical protein
MTRTPNLWESGRMSMEPSIALTFLGEFAQRGMCTQVVLPDLDDRFFVSRFGRDVPAPRSRFRRWASQLNIEQIERALLDLRQASGEKLLMPTGVRLGESVVRDSLIVADAWPDRWRGREVRGNVLILQVIADGIMRPLLGGELYA